MAGRPKSVGIAVAGLMALIGGIGMVAMDGGPARAQTSAQTSAQPAERGSKGQTENAPIRLIPIAPLSSPESGDSSAAPAESAESENSGPRRYDLPEGRSAERPSGDRLAPEGTVRGNPVATTMKSEGIAIGTLGEINADSLGVLDSTSGGFGLDMWRGVPRQTAHRLVSRLPAPLLSLEARDLMRRLLLSAAWVPEDSGDLIALSSSADSPRTQEAAFLAARLDRLIAIGATDEAQDLLRLVPNQVENPAIDGARRNLAFLANDNAGACSATRRAPAADIAWRKALIFCQLLEGRRSAALIGADLLREQGVADATFFALVRKLAGGSEVDIPSPAPLSPLHLAMMRAAQVPVPAASLESASPAALKTIALSPNAGIETRLDAAERAASLGALAVESLARLYASVDFAQADLAAALSIAETGPEARGRALLYQAAKRETVPAARAELLAGFLSLSGDRRLLAFRIITPWVADMTATADLGWFAADAALALFLAGNFEKADAWLAVMPDDSAGRGNMAGWAAAELARAPATDQADADDANQAARPAGQADATRPGAMNGSAPAGPPLATPEMSVEPGSITRMNIAPAFDERSAEPLAGRQSEAGPETGSGPLPGPAPGARSEASPAMGPGDRVSQDGPLPGSATLPAEWAFDHEGFRNWWTDRAAVGPDARAERMDLLLALLHGVGISVPPEILALPAALTTVGPDVETAGSRSSVWSAKASGPAASFAAMEGFAAEGKTGGAVLMALVTLGGDAPESLSPAVIGPVLRALADAGLGDEARALAVEVAIAARL